jgi:hypothetical protein
MKRAWIMVVWLALTQGAVAVEFETFTTVGNPKTFGVDFMIDHPKAWQVRPAQPGGVAIFWSTPAGPGDSMSLIIPAGQNLEKHDVTKEEFRPLFDDPRMEKTIVAAMPGAVFIRKVYLEDYKYPAGYIDYVIKLKMPNGELTVKVRNYIVYLGKVMLQVQVYLLQDPGPDRIEGYAAELKQIIDSLVIIPQKPA